MFGIIAFAIAYTHKRPRARGSETTHQILQSAGGRLWSLEDPDQGSVGDGRARLDRLAVVLVLVWLRVRMSVCA